MLNGILDQFDFPGEGTADALRKQGIREVQLEDGVSRLMSGHDKGVAYRFYVLPVRNAVKSKLTKFPIMDEVEMIEWIVDRRTRPVERARELPPELLAFDDEGNCIGGRYKESYDRFKQGLSAPGLALSKWGVLSDSEVASLTELQIFTVEQFAAQPRAKIEGKFPAQFMDAFEQAIEYVNGKDGRAQVNAHAEKLAAQEQQIAKQNALIESLQKQVLALAGGDAPKKRGRKPKQEIEDED